jgi:hypothetical protein
MKKIIIITLIALSISVVSAKTPDALSGNYEDLLAKPIQSKNLGTVGIKGTFAQCIPICIQEVGLCKLQPDNPNCIVEWQACIADCLANY